MAFSPVGPESVPSSGAPARSPDTLRGERYAPARTPDYCRSFVQTRSASLIARSGARAENTALTSAGAGDLRSRLQLVGHERRAAGDAVRVAREARLNRGVLRVQHEGHERERVLVVPASAGTAMLSNQVSVPSRGYA